MEKKNTSLLVLVILLSLTIGLLGGYVISDKLVEMEDEQTEKDDKPNKDNEENVIKEYSIDAAEELMSNYMFTLCGSSYISELNNNLMSTLAIMGTNSTEKISCEDLKKDGLDTFNYGGVTGILYQQCLIEDMGRDVYKYNEVLSTYKKLFGLSNNLSKDSFDDENAFASFYYYSNSKQGFVQLEVPAGGDCEPLSTVGITSANIVNDNLEIVAYNKVKDVSVANYKYVFKKESGNYYLAEIIEIN